MGERRWAGALRVAVLDGCSCRPGPDIWATTRTYAVKTCQGLGQGRGERGRMER
jgi:hypothetical protein